jgi:hypothetical protein
LCESCAIAAEQLIKAEERESKRSLIQTPIFIGVAIPARYRYAFKAVASPSSSETEADISFRKGDYIDSATCNWLQVVAEIGGSSPFRYI